DDAIIAIESRLSQADVLAAVTVRDYAGACALYRQLHGECAAARAKAHEADWLQSQSQAQDDVLKALAAQGPERTRLEGLWAVAQELANGGEHARALQVLDKVRALVITEMKSTPPTQLGDDVAHRIATLEEDARVGEALRACHAFVKGPLQAVIDLAQPLGEPAPKEWAPRACRWTTTRR
ncbi:MAG: hypothetical protein MUC74_11360, partial [Ideonella sp.]|nr:hypothetical protein [Ideonella sp.]